MNPLTRYYINQAGGGGGVGGVGPIYAVPLFVQRGHGLGSFFGGLFRTLRPYIFSAIKALSREALRTGGRILTDIAENPQTGVKEIISKHVQDTFQTLGSKMMGRGRKRKRRTTTTTKRKAKKPRRTTRKRKPPARKRTVTKRRRRPTAVAINRDIFA
jgi:hypothetical protein